MALNNHVTQHLDCAKEPTRLNDSDFSIDAKSAKRQTVLHRDFVHFGADHEHAEAQVPAMVTPQERSALYQLGRHYTGIGAIVDAGCFLGASTVALASGVRDSDYGRSNAPRKVIHSYDIGVLPARKNPKAAQTKRYGDFEYTFGESFVGELENNIADVSQFVQLHIGDILTEQWSGEPIEICFLDICKSVSIDAHTAAMFFSSFIPGTTILVQQDYFFHRLPWIKTTLGALSEHFQWIGRIAHSSLYRCISTPAPEQLSTGLVEHGDVDNLLRLHRFPHEHLLDDRTLLKLAISQTYLLALKDQKDRALSDLDEIRRRYRKVIEDWDNKARSGAESTDGVASASAMLEQAQRQIKLDHVQRISW